LIGDVNKLVADEVGLSKTTFQRGETILKEDPMLWIDVKAGKLTINEGNNRIRRKKEIQQLLEEAKKSAIGRKLPEGFELIFGDFREMDRRKDVPDSSVDLILT